MKGGRYLGTVGRVVLVGERQAAQGLLAAKGAHCCHHPLLDPLTHLQHPRPIIAHHLHSFAHPLHSCKRLLVKMSPS